MYKINYNYSKHIVGNKSFYVAKLKELKRVLTKVFGSSEFEKVDLIQTLSSISITLNNGTSSVCISNIDHPEYEMLATIKILDDSFKSHKDYVILRDLCLLFNNTFFSIDLSQPSSEELIAKDQSSKMFVICVNTAKSSDKGFIGVNYMVKADDLNTAERKACLDAKIPYSHTNPTGYGGEVNPSNDLQYLNNIGWTVRD